MNETKKNAKVIGYCDSCLKYWALNPITLRCSECEESRAKFEKMAAQVDAMLAAKGGNHD